MGKLQFIANHLVHKQHHCNCHTNAIRTGLLYHTDLMVHIYMFQHLTGHHHQVQSQTPHQCMSTM